MAQGSQRRGRRTAVKRQHPEMVLHKACAQLLDIRQKQSGFFWTTIPSGGGGEIRGAHLKAMGLKPGVADILIFRKDFTAWIELKAPQGFLSQAQIDFSRTVAKFGHFYQVVRYLDELDDLLRVWKI